jgi:hypothetical protein
MKKKVSTTTRIKKPQIHMYLKSAKEKQLLKTLAKNAKMTITEYVHTRVFSGTVVDK